MVIQLAADAPMALRLAATTVLVVHIAAASASMVAGVVALATPKGGRVHRWAGIGFAVSLLLGAGLGAVTAPMIPRAQFMNTTGGLFTVYMIATAWLTVRPRSAWVRRLEAGLLLIPLGIVVEAIGLAVWSTPAHRTAVYGPVYVFAAIAAVAAVSDLRLLRGGGAMGRARTARHLWRMSLAMIIALGSFFVGQQRVLPEAVKGSPLLFAPMLMVLAYMAYWLVRVRIGRTGGVQMRPRASAA